MFDLPIINGVHPIQYLSPSVYWAHIGTRKNLGVPDEVDELHDGYNIYVDAKNGNDSNSGLFENVPVKTMFRAGNVMKNLPADREIKGTRIFLWGSTDGDIATYYREYLMNGTKTLAKWPEAKASPFVGMNNYMITANPRSPTLPLFDGSRLSPYDPRRENPGQHPTPQPTFFFVSGDKITLKKLRFTKTAGSCIMHTGNYGTFAELEAFNIYEDFIIASGNDALVEYCYFHHIDDVYAKGFGGDALRFGDNAKRPIVRYCVGHNSSAELYHFAYTTDGIFYLNDAFEAGYHEGMSKPRRTESVGVGFALNSEIDAPGPNTRCAAIANRVWNCAEHGFRSTDDSAAIFLHNVSVNNVKSGYDIHGDQKIILGNNVAYENVGSTLTQTLSRSGYYPRHRQNSWSNTFAPNALNKDMKLLQQPIGMWFVDGNIPTTVPQTGFKGNHFIPKDEYFKNISFADYGFGKDLGPTTAVVQKLKSMSIEQIRTQIRLLQS